MHALIVLIYWDSVKTPLLNPSVFEWKTQYFIVTRHDQESIAIAHHASIVAQLTQKFVFQVTQSRIASFAGAGYFFYDKAFLTDLNLSGIKIAARVSTDRFTIRLKVKA